MAVYITFDLYIHTESKIKKKELYIDMILSLVSLHSYYSLKEMQVFLLLFMHCDILS